MARVLIADPEEAARASLAPILGAAGHQVLVADTAARVLALAADQVFDVLITEAHLIDSPAWDLVPRLHRIDPALPVIAVTADDSWETSRRMRVEGGPIFYYELKPADARRLCRVIDSALQWRARHSGNPNEGNAMPTREVRVPGAMTRVCREMPRDRRG